VVLGSTHYLPYVLGVVVNLEAPMHGPTASIGTSKLVLGPEAPQPRSANLARWPSMASQRSFT